MGEVIGNDFDELVKWFLAQPNLPVFLLKSGEASGRGFILARVNNRVAKSSSIYSLKATDGLKEAMAKKKYWTLLNNNI